MASKHAASLLDRQMNAVVVSAGLMEKTVKVRIGVQKWNSHIRKNFNRTSHLLVHDPHSSLRLGDIITCAPGYRASKTVSHVVTSILAPFGEPISSRPPVPTPAELIAERHAKRRVKWARKSMRGKGVEEEEIKRRMEERKVLFEEREKVRGRKRERTERLAREKREREEGVWVTPERVRRAAAVEESPDTSASTQAPTSDPDSLSSSLENLNISGVTGEEMGGIGSSREEISEPTDQVTMEASATSGQEKMGEEDVEDEKEVYDALQQRVKEEVTTEKEKEKKKGWLW